MSVALVPGEAERAVWALLPPIALFLAVASLDVAQVRRLVFVFLGVAAFQAVLGLIQYGGGPDSMLRFGYLPYGDSAIGSYANRSHLAGLLGMALPIAMGLLAACIFGLHRGARVRRRGGLQGWLNRLASGGSKTNQMAVWSVLCLVLLLGIVFARSRTGIAVAMVGLVVTAVVLVRNFGGKFAAGMTGAVVGLGLTLAVTVGLAPVFARFGLDATQDLRWPMLETTLEAAWRFFPIGSGPGSFVEVFRSVHPQAIGGEAYVNHAHNDYAEWWLEGGVPAVLLILAFIVLYVRRWRGVWAVRGWDSFHMMQVGAGVGLLMLALFGLTDYNLRIPANQIYFALLAAVFFHPGRPGGKEAGVRGPMRKVYASVAEAGGMAVTRPKDGSAAIDPWVEAPASPGVQPTAPPSSPLKGSNPFME
jgi:O-antigen ligase